MSKQTLQAILLLGWLGGVIALAIEDWLSWL
jgi:hypothetical protein